MSEKKEPPVQKFDLNEAFDRVKEQIMALEKRIKALEDRWNDAVEKGEIHLH